MKAERSKIAGLLLLIAVLGLLAVGAALFFWRDRLPFAGSVPTLPTASTAPVGTREPRVGSIAPDFTLEIAGKDETLSLQDLRGRPVWVNFWATWCPPCREEMPEMERLYKQYRAQGLEIVALDVEESSDDILAFTTELGLTFPVVRDADGEVTDLYFVAGLPSHFFIDRVGTIQAIHMGSLVDEMGQRAPFEEYLQKILAP